MASFLTITLLASAFLLALMLGLKRFEMRRGRVLFSGLRPRTGGLMHRGVVFVESALPALAVGLAHGAGHGLRSLARRAMAQTILLFEQFLHRLLALMHDMTRPPQAGGPASAFLQEVAQHKRALQKRAVSKRMILDDN